MLTLLIMHSGDGKSSLLRTAVLAAAKRGHKCLLVSTEDPEPYVLDRFLAELTGIPTKGLSRLDATTSEKAQLKAALGTEALNNITLVSELLDVSSTLTCVETWLNNNKSNKPALVCVDYLQNLVIGSNAEESLTLLGQQLNALAGKTRSAIIGASQVRSDMINEAKRRLITLKPPTQKPPNWIDFACVYQPTKGDAERARALEKTAKCVAVGFRPGLWAKLPPLSWDVPDDKFLFTFTKSNFTGGTGGTQHLVWDGNTQTIREP